MKPMPLSGNDMAENELRLHMRERTVGVCDRVGVFEIAIAQRLTGSTVAKILRLESLVTSAFARSKPARPGLTANTEYRFFEVIVRW